MYSPLSAFPSAILLRHCLKTFPPPLRTFVMCCFSPLHFSSPPSTLCLLSCPASLQLSPKFAHLDRRLPSALFASRSHTQQLHLLVWPLYAGDAPPAFLLFVAVVATITTLLSLLCFPFPRRCRAAFHPYRQYTRTFPWLHILMHLHLFFAGRPFKEKKKLGIDWRWRWTASVRPVSVTLPFVSRQEGKWNGFGPWSG